MVHDDSLLICEVGLLSHKTINHEIINCNNNFLRYSGVKDLERLYGLTDHDFSWQKYSNVYVKHENDAMQNLIYNAIHPAQDYSGREFVIFNTKQPKHDEKNEIVGIISHSIEIFNPKLIELCANLIKTDVDDNDFKRYEINKPSININLSRREHECLFLLLRGHTAKTIAKILNISNRTVEVYYENLRRKFGCATKLELIATAIEKGYMNNIPASLFNSKLSSYLEK